MNIRLYVQSLWNGCGQRDGIQNKYCVKNGGIQRWFEFVCGGVTWTWRRMIAISFAWSLAQVFLLDIEETLLTMWYRRWFYWQAFVSCVLLHKLGIQIDDIRMSILKLQQKLIGLSWTACSFEFCCLLHCLQGSLQGLCFAMKFLMRTCLSMRISTLGILCFDRQISIIGSSIWFTWVWATFQILCCTPPVPRPKTLSQLFTFRYTCTKIRETT